MGLHHPAVRLRRQPRHRRGDHRRHRLRRAEVGEIVTGAITGGSGRYATARGEADQELLSVNNPELATMGINKTVEFELARR